LTVSQIRKIETRAIQTIGIPSLVLMDNAGRSVAKSVVKYLKKKKHPKVLIVCGCGNNGGDGLAAARLLWKRGFDVKIFFARPPGALKSQALWQWRLIQDWGIPFHVVQTRQKLLQSIQCADLAIDALTGIGARLPLAPPYAGMARAVNRMRRAGAFVIAVDVPSGIDPDTGRASPDAVRAHLTVTFGFMKRGLLGPRAKKFAGRVVLADIGYPPALYNFYQSRLRRQ
jgi:NAD(P)H-hydrate epimerase